MSTDYPFSIIRFFLIILIFISSTADLYTQNMPTVSLTASKTDIQQWESVTLKATISYEDPKAYYIFTIDNKQIYSDNNQRNDINTDEFPSTGPYVARVQVRSGHYLLSDSLIINVRKVNLSVDPQEVFIEEKVNLRLGYQLPENYVKYRFHFGDNLPPSDWLIESQTTYSYRHTGNYKVYCEIGKFDGEQLYSSIQSEIKQVKVNIKPTYEVSLSAITYANVDEKIIFTANPITNDPNPNFRYQFYFGDNTETVPKSQKMVEHSYRKPGIYKASVKLRTIDNQERFDTVTIRVQELVIPQQSISFIVNPIEVKTNEKVNFKLELQNGYKNLRYRFNYGHNLSSSLWLTAPESSNEYEKPGNYEVYGEVGRFDGESVYSLVRSESKQVKVNPFYKVKLSAPVSVQVDSNVNFRVEVITNAENQDFKFQFEFGDLTPASTQSDNEIQHAFRQADTFNANVKLLSRDGKLLAVSDILRIKVNDIAISSETVLLNVTPMVVNADEEVHFKLELLTEYQNLRYRFYFGEGERLSEWLDIPESNYKYAKPYTYEVYADVGRFDGDSIYFLAKSETKKVVVNPFIDVRLLTETTSKVDEDITFIAEVSTNIANPDFKFLFDFGDSIQTKPQTENKIIHQFNKEGNYAVTVRLINNKGEVVAASSSIIIIEQPVNIFIYILIAIASLLGVSLTIKYLFKPKLKLQPKSDTGIQSITKSKDALIGLTIRLNPNVNQAELHLDTSGKKLIDKIRRIK